MIRFIHRFLFVAVLASQAHAAEPSVWTEKPITIPAKQREIRSEHTKRSYRVFVHVPSTPAPEEGFPVLYLLDGNVTYPLATLLLENMSERAASHGITPGIIVGIGYPVDTEIDPVGRTEDYTPPAPDLAATGDPSRHPQGGADRFLDFIEKELKPALAKDFRIDPARQTLFGHSYGGLLTLHALFTRPQSFQNYFAASPSIWWNQRYILSEKAAFLENKEAVSSVRVKFTVGSLEQSASPQQVATDRAKQVAERRQVDNSRELSAELRAAGCNADFVLFENENHGSARAAAVNQLIRFAFAAPSAKSPGKQ